MLTEQDIEPVTVFFKKLPGGKQNMARYFQGVHQHCGHSDRFVESDDRDTIILMAHTNTIKRG